MGPSINHNERFLSLTGVIVEQTHCATKVADALDDIKSLFPAPAKGPLILHRNEIVRREPPFDLLSSDDVRYDFNGRLIRALNQLEYAAITVLIDKRMHLDQYKTWQWPPYHYCLIALLERYLTFLKRRSAVGDVVVEARGKHEDRRLKKAFQHAWNNGTQHVLASSFQQRLTSREVKMKPKQSNDPGLQLADMIASPSHRSMLEERGLVEPADHRHFGRHVVEILMRSKYDRIHSSGKIDGCGRKFLPF